MAISGHNMEGIHCEEPINDCEQPSQGPKSSTQLARDHRLFTLKSAPGTTCVSPLQKPFQVSATVADQTKRSRVGPMSRHGFNERCFQMRLSTVERIIGTDETLKGLAGDLDGFGFRFENVHGVC